MRKLLIAGLAGGLVLALACCLLLPEGLVVKGPVLNSITGRSIAAPAPDTVSARFRVAPGYRVELFADGIQNARFLRMSPGGSLVVSQPRLGRLLRVDRDGNGDGRSDARQTLIEGLDRPHGFDFAAGGESGGQLFIGEGSAIARVAVTETGADSLAISGEPVRIVTGIPEGGNHWTRTLRVGPDGLLYLSVGSSCNVCLEEDARRAALLRYAIDGTGEEIHAAGLRNSVGFDWRPGSDELYATDNGRDLLGDDTPPCELNRIERGGFYGWPYAYADNQPDPDFGPGHAARIRASLPPAHAFGAHQAPLGITFLRHPDHPEAFRGAALVALHGSWNRSELSGYKVVSLHWDAEGRITERDFLTGFQDGDDVIGRPVDVAEGPDGAIYVSDDYAGAIYRITRADGVPASPKEPAPALPGERSTRDPLAAYDAATRDALASRGAALFEQNACAGCHEAGRSLPGVVPKPLERLASRYSVESLAAFLRTPQPPMPVVDLPEDDRIALAVHLLAREARANP